MTIDRQRKARGGDADAFSETGLMQSAVSRHEVRLGRDVATTILRFWTEIGIPQRKKSRVRERRFVSEIPIDAAFCSIDQLGLPGRIH